LILIFSIIIVRVWNYFYIEIISSDFLFEYHWIHRQMLYCWKIRMSHSILFHTTSACSWLDWRTLTNKNTFGLLFFLFSHHSHDLISDNNLRFFFSFHFKICVYVVNCNNISKVFSIQIFYIVISLLSFKRWLVG